MFRRPVQRYGTTPEPITPFQKAAQVWDERMGSTLAQARAWRALAFGTLGLSGLLAAGIGYIGAQNRIVPYIVEVGETGAVRGIAPADAHYSLSDAQIAWFLSRFIQDVRSVSSDGVVVRKDWLEAYGYVSGEAATFLSDEARRADPLQRVGHATVAVTVDSVVRASASSFQIKWTEVSFEDGAQSGTQHWTALATIQLQPPRNPDVLRRNPLGLYITAFAWSKDFDAAVETPVTPSSPQP